MGNIEDEMSVSSRNNGSESKKHLDAREEKIAKKDPKIEKEKPEEVLLVDGW